MEERWRLIRTKRNRYYYVNENGNKSQNFFYAEEYHNGFAKVRNKAGLVYFRDADGNLSESFYFAGDYKNGFAKVQKEKDCPCQFRDTRGKLSEGFYEAYNYCNGFAIVRKGPINSYHFRDIDGNLSEGFYSIENYNNGLAKVQKCFGKFQYRDIYGNLYDSEKEARDALMKIQVTLVQNENVEQLVTSQVKNYGYASIEDYFKNEVSAYFLSPKDIYNNLDKIVVWEKYNCKLEMKNADSQRRAEIFERYSVVAEYIRQTAYEYSEELKIEEYTDRLF